MKKVGTMLLMLCMVSAVCACALFHQHTWNDPTCTEPKTCSACGEKEGEALGHAWTDATCTASKACFVCGATEGEAMGHAWTDATCTEPKTCSVCGVTEGVALGHTWTDATCTASKACSVCGATEGEASGHTWVEATCMEPKTCSVCGVTEGEALGHTWVDATCTEPKTCSVCGATEGDPLGHTEEIDPAAAPTCTESGFTEGAHCSICGAVLVPQKTVPALGHNWAAATFSDPKTCQVCCATEGEALGSQLFVNALNPDLSAESRGASLEALTGEEDAFVSTRKKIRITGSAKGIDSETEDIINNSSILLTIDQEEKTSARLKIEAVVNGSKPVNILFTVDEAGLGFTLPGIVEEYYKVEFETLLELLGGNASFQTIASSAQMAAGSMEKNRDLLLKYEKILFDVANGHNTTETVGEYALTGMGKVQNCRIIVCNPSANDWRKMLETILTTAQSDTELMDQIVGRSYSEQMQQYLGSWEAYEQMMRGMIEEWITSALENVPSMAKNLAGTTLEFAYEGMRLYGIRITTRFGDAIAYESFGDTQTGRTDALFLYEDEEPTLLAENRLERHSRRVTGRFSIPLAEVEVSYILGKTEEGKPVFDFLITVEESSVRLVLGAEDADAVFRADYDDFDCAVSVQAVITDADGPLAVPEGPVIVLNTEEEIKAAAEKISDELYKAELFGHVWQEATCTEPKTCTVCEATEGEALGHSDILEFIETDNVAATRIIRSVCDVCGAELDIKEEKIQTFIENGAFSFTSEEFVARLQKAWDEHSPDLFFSFKHTLTKDGEVCFDYYYNNTWLGWGQFYSAEDGHSIKSSEDSGHVSSIIVYTPFLEGLDASVVSDIFELLIGPCVCAVDPTIQNGELYETYINGNQYAYDKKALHGIHYSSGLRDEYYYFLLIDIAEEK